MNKNPGKHQLSRRSFLTAISGLGVTSMVPVEPLKVFPTPAAESEFVGVGVGGHGANFTLHKKAFYFAGTNNYYLHYKTHLMIDDVFKNVVAMGLPAIRLWGFLDGQASDGVVMQPTPGIYPEAGYERFDYTVSKAASLGIKLVVVLVNNWNDFGGMNQYVTWFGVANHDDFYTNAKIKTAYKNYVQHFLQRKNRYTGRVMTEEPAIMAWELVNEPHCQSDITGNTLFEWVHEMSSFLKSIDGQHLVAVGDEGWYNVPGNADWAYAGSQGVDWLRLIALPTIDYGTVHLYPDDWKKNDTWAVQWIKDHIRDGHAAGKPVVLEEFGWRDQATRDAIYTQWTNTVYQAGGNGDQFWILTGLQDDGTLYRDYDGFRVTYPSSTTGVLSAHAAKMRSKRL